LLWLERQGAPEIYAPEATERDVMTVFVPVNDTSVVGSFDKEIDALRTAEAAVREASGKAAAAAEKKRAKAEASLVEAVRKAVAEVPRGKEGKAAPAEAESLLPERRKRQPRTFPSVAPEGSAVVFTWRGAEPSAEVRGALDGLAARVARLGHSSSLVSVRVVDEAPPPTWSPAGEGEVGDEETPLRVVAEGQLEALCAAFALHRGEASGRVMPATFQRYVRPTTGVPDLPPGSVFDDDWIVLCRVDGPRLPSTRAADVSRTLRKALMAAYGEGAPEILSGHRPAGERSERPHLAYVPLPFVAHERADGSLLGAALVLPRGITREERKAVFAALDRWERSLRRGDEETPRLPVHLGRAGELWLERVETVAPQHNLRPATWCDAAATWATATPIALDRNPGDLRSSDPAKEAAAYAEAEETVARACEHIGLPRPARVTVTPAAPLAGGDKARHFPGFTAGGVQRVLVHATLTFAAPVRGPVLLGAGRYFGLGLCRPLPAGREHG
jgi:CRISPR-associated protein Csb2